MRTVLSNSKRSGFNVTIQGDAWVRCWPKLLFLFVACSVIFWSPMQAGACDLVVVGMTDHEATIELEVGELVRIDLPGNAGTGFMWGYDLLDLTIFSKLGSHRVIEKEGEPWVGNAYLQSWFLLAKKPGVSTVRLLYYRFWEGKDMAEKEFKIEVVVRH